MACCVLLKFEVMGVNEEFLDIAFYVDWYVCAVQIGNTNGRSLGIGGYLSSDGRYIHLLDIAESLRNYSMSS